MLGQIVYVWQRCWIADAQSPAFAREDGSTLNQFIVSAVAEKISVLKTAEYFTDRAVRGDKAKALRFLLRKGGEEPRGRRTRLT